MWNTKLKVWIRKDLYQRNSLDYLFLFKTWTLIAPFTLQKLGYLYELLYQLSDNVIIIVPDICSSFVLWMVKLQFWCSGEYGVTSSLPLLPGTLWTKVPVPVTFIDQIDLSVNYLYYILEILMNVCKLFLLDRNTWYHNCMQANNYY